MKVKYSDWRGDKHMTVASAVDHAIEPDAYSYSGSLEKTEMTLENTASLLGRLVEALADGGKLTREQVQQVIGYNYEVEP